MTQLSPASGSARRLPAKGMTLIEVCAVMVANAILIAAVLSALYALGRADRANATRVERQRGVTELSARLRSDLHAARILTWDDAAGLLRLDLVDDKAIVYSREENRWERRLVAPAAAAATGDAGKLADNPGELTAAFPVPSQLTPTIAPPKANAGEQIRIVWKAEQDADRERAMLPTPAEMSITLGRDERILHE